MSTTGYSQWFRPGSSTPSGSFDGAIIDDYDQGANQSMAVSGGAIVLLEHTAEDTGGYVTTSHFGQKTLAIPSGGHGYFNIRAKMRLTKHSGTLPASGYFSITLYLHTSGGGPAIQGDINTIDYPYTEMNALDRDVSVAWSTDVWLDDDAYIEFFAFNNTDQSLEIFHFQDAHAPPSASLAIQRINDASAP